MTFSLAGSTITQTGFDASLSGLTGISGVTVNGQSSGKLHYVLTGRQLIVNGSLIIDPEIECLEFDTTSALVNLTYNGKLQIGRKRASTGEISTVTTTIATGLDGKYFTFNDGTTAFYVWFTVGGVGTDPAPGGAGILCALLGTDTANDVATKVQDAIMSRIVAPLPLVDVSVATNVVTIRNNRNVTATDTAAGTSGFTVAITQQGATDGRIRYSDGDALIFSALAPAISAPSANAIIMDSVTAGNVFIGYGGRIVTGCPVRLSANGGTVAVEALHYYARITNGDTNAAQLRFGNQIGDACNISNLTLDTDPAVTGRAVTLFQSAGPTSFSAIFKSGSIQNLGGLTPPTGDFTFTNLEVGSNYLPNDVVGNYSTANGAAVPVWTLNNTDVGTATRITNAGGAQTAAGRINVLWQQNVVATLKDVSNNPITSNALIWLIETDDGNRFDAVGRTGFNWLTVQTYSQAVNGSGEAAITVRTGIGFTKNGTAPNVQRSYFGKTTADDFDIYAVSYLYNIAVGTHILRGNGGYNFDFPLATDASITQTNKATVDAYTTLETPEKFYDRAKSWLLANYSGQTAALVSRSGNTINAGSRNVVIDATAASVFSVVGNTITIKATTFTGNMTTTGTISLANGAVFVGSRTDSTGTISNVYGTVTGIVSGSRIQVYNDTTDTEVANEIVSGTSWSLLYTNNVQFSVGDTVRVRLAYQSGTTAKIGYESFAIATSTGWSLLALQESDDVYASIGINGGTVTEFTADYPNVQVDINDPDGITSINRLYAWFVNICTTVDGIRYWLNGIEAEDTANFKIITSKLNLRLDNLSSSGVLFTGDVRLYRDDGAAPVVSSTTGGGSITLYAGKVYTSGLTPVQNDKLMSLPSNALTTPLFLALK